MTKKERAKIREAVVLLMEDDGAGPGFHAALRILAPMAGLRIPAADVEVRPIELSSVNLRAE